MDSINHPALKLLLLCCRQSFGPAHTDALQQWATANGHCESFDWSLVYRLAVNHGVAPLIFKNLQTVGLRELGIPFAIIAAFQQQTYQSIAIKAGIRTKLVEIIQFCAARNIRVMILKGSALDQTVYHAPWYVSHDVDLVFDRRQGALSPPQIAEVNRYFWDLPGFEYDFYAHHDVTMNGMLPVDFGAIWNAAEPIDLGEAQAWIMCPTDMMLAAAINSCRKRFFRLKSLLAIATLLESYPGLDWSTLFAHAHEYRCGTILYGALVATQRTVGCTLPQGLAKELGVSAARMGLIHQLVDWCAQTALLQGNESFSPTTRRLDRSLLLPYTTYNLPQLWYRLHSLLSS